MRLAALERSRCLRIRSQGGEGAAVGRQLVKSQVCASWQGHKERRAANSSESLGCAAACLALVRDPPVVLTGTARSQEQGDMKGLKRAAAALPLPGRGWRKRHPARGPQIKHLLRIS